MRRLLKHIARGSGSGGGENEPSQVAQSPIPPIQIQSTVEQSSSGDPSLFSYQLLNPSSSFRILRLQRKLSGGGDGPYESLQLYGSLIEASFANPPKYFALSYCWGDPALRDEIIIDGRVLRITASCGSALRRMLRGKIERLIWVDSICINQANTPEALAERGQQVAVMDQIYRGAEQVNVHLGEGDAASDAACEALKSLVAPYLGAKLPGPQQEACRRKYEALVDDILECTTDFPYGKLYGIFRYPWFRRCWVIQEVALGRKVMFYCGQYLLNMKNMVVAADFTRLPYSKVHSKEMAFHWKSYLDYHDALNEFIRRKEEGEPISNFGMTLSTIIMLPALSCEATRPEDKIYALYGLCKRFGFNLPVPDYQKPLAAVYTEAASAIIQNEQGLDILGVVTESSAWQEHGLPSWVPNFSGCMRNWSPSNPPHSVVGATSKSKVSGTSSYEYILEPGATRLVVNGRRLGVVLETGLPWMGDATTTLLGNATRQTGQYIDALVDSIGGWYDLARVTYPHGDGTIALQALVRTLLLARDSANAPTNVSMTFDIILECLSAIINVSKSRYTRQGQNTPMVLKTPRDSFTNIVTLGDYQISTTIQMAMHQIFNMQWKTVLRVAESPMNEGGRLGIGTHTVMPDDLVVVFSGSPRTAILRPYEDGFRYIGPGCVDGVMDGTFWNGGSEMDDEWFVLI